MNFARRVHKLDRAALVELHDALYPQLYRYALYSLGQRKVSQEIAAEAFLKLVGAIRQRLFPSNLRSWLLAATSDQVQASLQVTFPDHPPGTGDGDSDLTRYGSLFRRSLHKISPAQQHFLALRFSQESSFTDIAGWLNCQEHELRSLQFQSLNALLGVLGGKMVSSSDESLERALQVCLQHLEKGSRLDELSASYPKWSEELHALLEVAYFSQYPGGIDPRQKPAAQAGMDGLEGALAASRSEFLQAAQVSLPVARPGRGLRWLALGIGVIILLAACGSMLAVLSMNGLPGSALHGIKLRFENAGLNLKHDPSGRLEAELRYDQRRVEEVEEIFKRGQTAPVVFSGQLVEQEAGSWQVGGIPVAITAGTEILGDILPGYAVTVQGVSTGDGMVQADQLQMREVQVEGEVQTMSETSLQVDGLQVTVTPETIWQGQVMSGDQVVVYLLLPNNGVPEARLIEVIE